MRCLSAAAALLVCGCLENEEVIRIDANGGVEVTVIARGDVEDLCDGFPVPQTDEWSPAGLPNSTMTPAATRAWLAGSRSKTLTPDMVPADENGNAEIAVTTKFNSVGDLPASYAPLSEPYAESYLERVTTLQVERDSGRTIYRFERTFLPRDDLLRYGRDRMDEILDSLPKALQERLKSRESLSEDQLNRLQQALTLYFRTEAELLVRESLQPVFLAGGPAAEMDSLAATLEEVLSRVEKEVKIDIFVDYQNRLRGGERENDVRHPLSTIEAAVRNSIRTQLKTSLQRRRVPQDKIHQVLYHLERRLTEVDHTSDLSDEVFKVRIQLPGRVVHGNFRTCDGQIAEWRFEAKELRHGPASLRLVSVVE